MRNLSQFFHGHPRKLGCEMRSLIPYIFGGWRSGCRIQMKPCGCARLVSCPNPGRMVGLKMFIRPPHLYSCRELNAPSEGLARRTRPPGLGKRTGKRTGTTGTRVDAPAQVIARGKPGTALVKASTLVIRERHQWLGTALTARTRARRPQRRSRARVSLCQKVPP